MAIAPLGDPNELGQGGAVTPLRLIRGGRLVQAGTRRAALHAKLEPCPDRAVDVQRSRADHPTAQTEVILTATASGHAAARTARAAAVRAQTLSRRRRTLAALATVVALGLLAVPVRALGAVTVSGQTSPIAAPAGLADGSTYVVQPGDTIRSIAMRINPSDLVTLERELVASTGSSTLVAGEHVVIP